MQKDSPIVSVIMPAYNSEGFLGKSIGSLLKQTKVNFELIFVDDGSQDETLQKAKEILSTAQFDYKLIHQPNKGVSSARNRGIQESSGQYICFVDSDDEVVENMFEVIEEQICREKPDALLWQHEDVKDDKILNPFTKFKLKDRVYPGFLLLYKMYVERSFWISISTSCYKRQLIFENSIKFPEFAKIGEDQNFNIKFFSFAERCIYIPRALYRYHYNPSSATKKASINLFDYYYAMEDAKKHLCSISKGDDLNNVHAICDSIEFSWIPRNFVHQFLQIINTNDLTVDKLQGMIQERYPYLLEKIHPLLIGNTDKNILINLFIKMFAISPSFAYSLYKVFNHR